MDESQKINFRILGIHILEFNYLNPSELNDFDRTKEPSVNLKFSLNYRWDIEKEIFGIITTFIYAIENKGENLEGLKLSYIIEFNIKDLRTVFTERSNNDFDINQVLETTLVGLAFSTGRGILYEKVQGTPFSGFIVPPIIPGDFILSKKLKSTKE